MTTKQKAEPFWIDEPDWLDLLPCGLERVIGGQACCAVVATTGNRDQAVVLYPG
jgi:hypothetical protein